MMSRSTSRSLWGFLVGFVLLMGVSGGYWLVYRPLERSRLEAEAVASGDALRYGAVLFETRGCAGCHRLDSAGANGNTGPNLTGIAKRHDTAYLRQSIREPNAVIASGCPRGTCPSNLMPQFGQTLDATQIDALITYLQAQP